MYYVRYYFPLTIRGKTDLCVPSGCAAKGSVMEGDQRGRYVSLQPHAFEPIDIEDIPRAF